MLSARGGADENTGQAERRKVSFPAPKDLKRLLEKVIVELGLQLEGDLAVGTCGVVCLALLSSLLTSSLSVVLKELPHS